MPYQPVVTSQGMVNGNGVKKQAVDLYGNPINKSK